jgi:hypothetical protein
MDGRPALMHEAVLGWAQRILWILCILVYLGVFIGGLVTGGDELLSMARAAAFTIGVAALGRIALNLLGRATFPVERGPSTDPDGTVGSLAGLMESTNVAQHKDGSQAAEVAHVKGRDPN